MTIKSLISQEMIDKYTEAGFWGDENVLDFLDKDSKLYGNKEAFVEGDIRITFNELLQNINRLANKFVEMGIKKEMIIGVQLPNCIEFIYTYYALSKIGAIALPIHTPLRKKEIEDIIDRFDCQLIIAPDEFRDFDFADMYQDILSTNSKLKHVIIVGDKIPKGMRSFSDLISQKTEEKPLNDFLLQYRPGSNDINSIYLTSGTTGGKIKGVMWTLNMFTYNGKAFNESYLISHNDVVLFLGPFTHIAFVLAMNAFILMGTKLVTVKDMNIQKGIELIEKEKITVLMAVPAQYSRMIDDPEFKKRDTSSLRTIISYGSAVPPELVKKVRDEMKCHFNLWYGTTEAGYCTTKWGLPLKTLQETVGSPQRGSEWKIIDMQGRSLPPGKEGEICISGPARSAGYYNDDELNEKSFDKEGWFHTGDLGFIDEDGNVHVTGRIKDLIIRGGENILPIEIENEIFEHPSVKDVAVIGMPDPDLGEKVCAYVQLESGKSLTLEELREFLKNRGIAYFKLPERLEFIDKKN
ncbi:MAG: acyl--CoA ligase [Deltaproteobacteria bacterium]|nr:acyl--CoA ligase [Deltaproteobacteria bacterium]